MYPHIHFEMLTENIFINALPERKLISQCTFMCGCFKKILQIYVEMGQYRLMGEQMQKGHQPEID